MWCGDVVAPNGSVVLGWSRAFPSAQDHLRPSQDHGESIVSARVYVWDQLRKARHLAMTNPACKSNSETAAPCQWMKRIAT